MTAHAKLSASGSSRWLNCPGSVAAESSFDNTSSIFAQEGTAAHELADIHLSTGRLLESYLGEHVEGVEVTPEMVEHVAGYCAYVRSFTGQHMYEVRVDFSPWVPEGFGTSDAIVISDDVVHIIDLKYGKGVVVDAEQNSQAMLYALGVYNDFDLLLPANPTFRLHIYQPRVGNFSEWEISLKDLLKWGEWVKLRAEEALSDDAERVPGEKQCQWCKAKGSCKSLMRYTEQLISAHFDDLDELENPHTISNSQLSNILLHKKLIIGWLDAVEGHAMELAQTTGLEGFKLVRGRSLRQWKDVAAAEQQLAAQRGDEAYERKLISVAKAEKLMGKRQFDALMADHVIKPDGKPALVPNSDPRKPIGDMTDCFDALD